MGAPVSEGWVRVAIEPIVENSADVRRDGHGAATLAHSCALCAHECAHIQTTYVKSRANAPDRVARRTRDPHRSWFEDRFGRVLATGAPPWDDRARDKPDS